MIKDRDYQVVVAKKTMAYISNGGKAGLVLAPTGTGKSVMLARACKNLITDLSDKVLLCTHVKELIVQNYEKLLSIWPTAPAGIYSSGLNSKNSKSQIVYCGIGSVANKPHIFGKVKAILIDEAHRVDNKTKTMYAKFINALLSINPDLIILGYTATGWRTGKNTLCGDDEFFSDVIVDMTDVKSFNWFLSQGYLAPLVPKRTNTQYDTTNLHIRMGEYVQEEMEDLINDPYRIENAVREIIHEGRNRNSWLVFVPGVSNAHLVKEEFIKNGITCETVVGLDNRDDVIRDFKNGNIKCIINVNILTTGFDHPGVDLIGILRPSASSLLWVQILGRGTRPLYAKGFDLDTKEGRLAAIANSPKQNCLVLDFVGNTEKLGPINDPVKPVKGKKGGEAPVKMCVQCSTYNHAAARFCIGCGFEFPFQTKDSLQEASTKELIKKSKVEVQEELDIQVFRVETINYNMHQKAGKPDMIKVSYHCEKRTFYEYVCIGHPEGNYARTKAVKWWKERTNHDANCPTNAVDALEQLDFLPVATHIRVWMNPKSGYPEIMAHCFDGSAFGKHEVSEEKPSVMNAYTFRARGSEESEYDDDLPF